MFKTILQPVFREKPCNSLLLKARIYVCPHMWVLPESSTTTEAFHLTPDLVINWILPLRAGIACLIKLNRSLFSISERKQRQNLCKAAFISFASAP